MNGLVFRKEVFPADPDIIRDITASTGFFYDYEIEVAVELADERLKRGEESGYYFCFAELDGNTVAYACFGPIACTKSSFDLFWIVTHKNHRGKGIGVRLLEETEKLVKGMGGTNLIAETSSRSLYLPTRTFYEKNHYVAEARIRDFYGRDDDKIVYVKRFA
jgi:GNAT superfamily N-acetyltransferase